MSDDRILLHQYDTSPFSEKVRVLFGILGVEWHAVDQPVIMPKPDLTCLTGGYRRIPVLQIGAEIFCDSQLIMRVIERRFGARRGAESWASGLASALGFWSDRSMFQAAVTVIFGGIGDQVDPAFKKDREALTGRPFDIEAMKAAVPFMTDQLRAHCRFLEMQLDDGRQFLLGNAANALDASAYYNIWFVRRFHPAAAGLFDTMPSLASWRSECAPSDTVLDTK